MSKIIPLHKLNADEKRFVRLSIRLKVALGFEPAEKGMMDLLEACCDKMEALKDAQDHRRS